MESLEKLWNDKDNQIISLANTIGAMNANSGIIQNEVKLGRAVKDIPDRPNLDFTDNLWKIMRSNEKNLFVHFLLTFYTNKLILYK